MFNGKMKALTFSYDDGVTQDQRLIGILNKYGLKGTFNLNSQLLGMDGRLRIGNTEVDHIKLPPKQVRRVYEGHEVAVHTLTHPNLTEQEDAEVIRQVEEDRLRLSELVGYEVCGMAYPCGGVNNNDRVAQLIKEHTGVRYSRTIISSHSFALQENLYRFNPTLHHREWDKLHALTRAFVDMKPDSPVLFYIWGHSYEFDADDSWVAFEDVCRDLADRDDIFYGTNKEILL